MVGGAGSDGADVLVLAWMFCSILAFRASAASLLGSSAGFVRPTTSGLSWPLDVGGVSDAEGAILVWALGEKLVAGACRWRSVVAI